MSKKLTESKANKILEDENGKLYKQLRITAEQIETKETKFMTFRAVTKGGKLIDCRFVKEAKNIPTTEGRHTIEVYIDDMNIDERREYPILWVKTVKRIVDESEVLEEIKAKSKEKLDELF